jgi:hypothetical protein
VEVESSYGLWSVVIVYSLVFIIFAFSFAGPTQWPTLLTLAMFPVLLYMYLRLARRARLGA